MHGTLAQTAALADNNKERKNLQRMIPFLSTKSKNKIPRISNLITGKK